MHLELSGEMFSFIAKFDPERTPDGAFLLEFPQSRYRNARNLRLNKHGSGPFCRFRIPPNLPHEGVYVITVDRNVLYIGECLNLSQRFGPSGYGAVQPRNCYEGGQSTNCKMNNLILQQCQKNRTVELWFRQTADRKRLEAVLIAALRPEWNGQMPVVPKALPEVTVIPVASHRGAARITVTQGCVSAQNAPEERNQPGGFTTYENMTNPHVTIHRDGCHRIKQHGGEHRYRQGGYRQHGSYAEAESYANRTGLPVRNCFYCKPRA